MKSTQIDNSEIAELVNIRKENYLNDPLQIVTDYNNEHKNINDYNGRQLLEMIQNANDESDTKKSKKVLIQLDTDTLLIANNGNPFSKGGVESLMYSDLSPKVMEENKVGKKGLGFRSILNWSKEIYIASYDLHLKFSQQHAEAFLDELIAEKPEIVTRIGEKTKEKKPISILRCPYIESDTSNKKTNAYDTVIELTLKTGVYGEIVTQIDKDIVPEILIFLNKLHEIEVKTPNEHFVYRKEETIPNQVIITKEDLLDKTGNQKWTWYILEDSGVLEGKNETKNYELKIAYNPSQAITHQKLFSFFRTAVNFPYPVIAHGSFELKADRNHLTQDENGFNKMLLKKLAKLMVDGAIALTKDGDCSYEALKLVVPNRMTHSILNEAPWNFSKLMEAEIIKASIFPTIKNHYSAFTDVTKFYKINIAGLIPNEGKEVFEHLLKYTANQNIIKLLERLAVSSTHQLRYQDSELTDKVNILINQAYISETETVEWLYYLCHYYQEIYIANDSRLPNLLLDLEKKPIEYGLEAISPPEGVTYKMPDFANISFVDTEQYAALKRRFQNITRDLTTNLKRYKLTEYALNVVVRRIITATVVEVKAADKAVAKSQAIQKMHLSLFKIYQTTKDKNQTINNIDTSLPSPLVYTKKGAIKTAKNIYFGKGYKSGELMQGLLSDDGEDIFIGSIEQNKLQSIDNQWEVEDYFKWIGVSELPKKEDKSIKAYRYDQHLFIEKIINELDYPYQIMRADEFKTKQDFNDSKNFIFNALWYNDFEKIIKDASIEYLITWFLKDKSLYNSITTNNEPLDKKCSFRKRKKKLDWNINHDNLQSYILYILKTIPFIPVKNGEKVLVSESMLEGVNLSPLIKTPIIDYTAKIFTDNHIDRKQINFILNRLGIQESLKDLNLNHIYGYLIKHDTVFKDNPKNVQNFYNVVKEATKGKDIPEDLPNRKKYFKEGKIYAERDDEKGFVPIADAVYVDNPNFSKDLLRKLNRAKLPMRSGNNRIQTLFGVMALDKIKFKVEQTSSHIQLNEKFEEILNQIKPILFTYRHQKALTKNQADSELQALKQLKIKTCFDISIQFKLTKDTETLELQDYEFIQDDVSKIFYVKIPKNYEVYNTLKKEWSFKETVADIICGAIKVSENRKDFMLLLGESPNNWDKILKREFDNYQEIEKEIAQKFEGIQTSTEKFWNILFNAAMIASEGINFETHTSIYPHLKLMLTLDEFHDFWRTLNYAELSKKRNIEAFKIIFESLSIDIEDFNEQKYKTIDIKYHWKNKLKTFNDTFKNQLASYLFTNDNYDNYSETLEKGNQEVPCENSLYFDYKQAHQKVYTVIFSNEIYTAILNTAIIDIGSVFKKNKALLKQKLEGLPNFSASRFQDLSYHKIFDRDVLFNKTEALIALYQAEYATNSIEKKPIKIGNREVQPTNTNDLLSAIENDFKGQGYVLEITDMKAGNPSFGDKHKGKRNPRQSNNQQSGNLSNTQIGFIGEKYAFEILKQEFDKVEWVSEYALIADFPSGTDGLGYDFKCQKGDETRYIEVKSTTTSNNAFHISKNEINIGHQEAEYFDILLITNLLSSNKSFKYLKNIFTYTNHESFLKNSKFSVENDSYKIKFK